MKLPESFVTRMEELLGEEIDAFLESYDDPRLYGLRVNTLKISVEEYLKITPFHLTPIPWTRDGFYYTEEDKPTKHPHYFAGLYYIQEPSAMAPVNVLAPQPDDLVLDMCACPGGKSIQIASYLGEKGLLVSNDISSTRIKALVKNIEMMGIRNVLIVNTTETVIEERFQGVFDKLLIDAPCSGEGMFRKEPKMVASWDTHHTDHCRGLQDSILSHVAGTLRDGGEMVYSTCTFSAVENENTLEHFMDENNDFKVKPIEKDQFEFAAPSGYGRLWPHKLKGEGHFVARLEKTGTQERRLKHLQANEPPEYFKKFMADNLNIELTGFYEEMNDKLYLRPLYDFDLKGVRVVRYGLLLGEVKGNKIIPSPALAMILKAGEAVREIDLPSDSIEVIKYLKGETLHLEGPDGLTLICTDGYPLGWGRLQNNTLKNMYHIGWRLM